MERSWAITSCFPHAYSRHHQIMKTKAFCAYFNNIYFNYITFITYTNIYNINRFTNVSASLDRFPHGWNVSFSFTWNLQYWIDITLPIEALRSNRCSLPSFKVHWSIHMMSFIVFIVLWYRSKDTKYYWFKNTYIS